MSRTEVIKIVEDFAATLEHECEGEDTHVQEWVSAVKTELENVYMLTFKEE